MSDKCNKLLTMELHGEQPPAAACAGKICRFAEENIRTWKFYRHEPTTFMTTFQYSIDNPSQCEYSNSSEVLDLPLNVRIRVKGLMTCDPAAEIHSHR